VPDVWPSSANWSWRPAARCRAGARALRWCAGASMRCWRSPAGLLRVSQLSVKSGRVVVRARPVSVSRHCRRLGDPVRSAQDRPPYDPFNPQDKNLRREFKPRVDRGPTRGQQGDEPRSHAARERDQSPARHPTATICTEYSAGPTHNVSRRGATSSRSASANCGSDEPGVTRSFPRKVAVSACRGRLRRGDGARPRIM
jgi:hypothetical protein